jgi:hypothetical protein
MRRIFWGFCRNWFLIDAYTTFRAVPILASNLRRYSKSKNDSPTWRISDSAFEYLKENSGSRHGESGNRYLNFLNFIIDFPNFKQMKFSATYKDRVRREFAHLFRLFMIHLNLQIRVQHFPMELTKV